MHSCGMSYTRRVKQNCHGVYLYNDQSLKLVSGGETRRKPSTSNEVMSLPAKEDWSLASDNEVISLTTSNVYTLGPATIPAGNKVIVSRWVYNKKTDNSYKDRVVVLDWGNAHGFDCGSRFAPVCRIRSICTVMAIAAMHHNTGFLNVER